MLFLVVKEVTKDTERITVIKMNSFLNNDFIILMISFLDFIISFRIIQIYDGYVLIVVF